MAMCILVGVFGGRKLDELFNGNGLYTMGGALLGVVAGFWTMYKNIMLIGREKKYAGNRAKG